MDKDKLTELTEYMEDNRNANELGLKQSEKERLENDLQRLDSLRQQDCPTASCRKYRDSVFQRKIRYDQLQKRARRAWDRREEARNKVPFVIFRDSLGNEEKR